MSKAPAPTTRLVVFQPKSRHEQGRFFDRVEDLLDALHADRIPPERVHTITNNTRTYFAVIVVPVRAKQPRPEKTEAT